MIAMSKKLVIFLLLIIITISGCSVLKTKASKDVRKKYSELGWKHYYDRNGEYSLYVPSKWFLDRGGKDFIQIYNYDPRNAISSQQFFGKAIILL
jgi:uncharacterized protein YceK